jgi:hypothetical protein
MKLHNGFATCADAAQLQIMCDDRLVSYDIEAFLRWCLRPPPKTTTAARLRRSDDSRVDES